MILFQLCKSYSVEWNMKSLSVDKIQKVVIVFKVTVMFCLSGTADAVRYKSNYPQFSCTINFCFHYNSLYRYQYTSKAAVIKLSFWVSWHVMILMCCRLQELMLISCYQMTDKGLLEGIGSLHELTSLRLSHDHYLSAHALSTFLHRPSMTSIVSLYLTGCCTLDDEGLKGIAERWNKLTYLHI
jgi:hypothetical protein